MELGNSDVKSFKTRELRSLLLVLVLSLAIAFTASGSSEGMNFSFPPFNNGRIQLQGDASLSSNSIQLTKAYRDQNLNQSVGWPTYREPMHLWDKATRNVADFTTRFTFIINSQGLSSFANGLTFFLVPSGFQLPDNSFGGALAIIDPLLPQFAPLVAIEFDNFYTNFRDWVDSTCPQVAHIGIDLNNLTSAVHSYVDWFKDKIKSGRLINTTIAYNSSTQNLSVLMIDADAMGTDINSSAINYRVDLTEYLPKWVTFDFSAAMGALFELHTIEAWEFSSNVQVAGKKSKLWLWSTLGSGSFILFIFVPAFIWFRHRSKRKRTYMSGEEDIVIEEEFELVLGPKKFLYEDLVGATNNFAIGRLLGEGGFGRVCQGYLTSVNAHVAVKKISPGSRQGIKEYPTEVKTISRLWHRNLVQLIGWCHKKKELFIYEFMSNGSLDSHLFKERTFLQWEKRYKIAQGIASALLYLHEEWEQCIVHGI